jgi:hypothetical protein
LLLQEPPNGALSLHYCEQLALQVANEHEIPMECVKKYPIVVETLRRRLTKSCKNDLAVAFAGMPPGNAYAAMSNIEKGHLHQAQIQRKQTNRNDHGKQW